MELVQPIREKSKIEMMKNILLKNGHRDYMLFVIGINTGLRVSDILSLKVADVKDKTHITIREQKTNKTKRFMINDSLRKEIDRFIDGMSDNSYLFLSRQGGNKPITRVQAYRILNTSADKVGLTEVGTHTLRKTFGYFHYQKFKDVAILQDIFNHSAPSVTMRYIGITEDIKDKTIQDFFL